MSINEITSSYAALSIEEQTQEKKDIDEWMDGEAREDYEHFSTRVDQIIPGYLGIGKKDGWSQKEGGQHETGFRFVRYMLRKFWVEKSINFQNYADIYERTLKAFSPMEQKIGDSNETPKVYIDQSITGWDQHSVSRLVGQVGSVYRENGPFFEILLNSAKTREGQIRGCPFHNTILANKDQALGRWNLLKALNQMPGSHARPAFYNSNLEDPEQFIKSYKLEHKKEPGPNSKRLLGALDHLASQSLTTQTVGNCWMKQNKRSVLVSLFIETATQRTELTYDEAWKISNKLYKKWKAFTKGEVEKLLDGGGITRELEKIAREKLARD